MRSKFVVVSLLLTLLSQQVMAGVVASSMMGSFSSEMPASEMSDMSHHNHQMTSEPMQSSGSKVMDCCQSDCAYCISGCYSLISALFSKELLSLSLQPDLQSTPELLVQSLESPFRPPIFA